MEPPGVGYAPTPGGFFVTLELARSLRRGRCNAFATSPVPWCGELTLPDADPLPEEILPDFGP